MNDDDQVSSVNWKWFCILAGTMILAGVATYFFLPALVSKTETDAIIVKAVETPIKVKPAEPSGKVVDHQNLLIVDILKGERKEADQTQTIRPSAPNPEPPPINVIMDTASEFSDGAAKETETINAPQKLTDVIDTTNANGNKNNNKPGIEGPEIDSKTYKRTTIATNKAVEKPIAKDGDTKKESISEMKESVIVIEGSAPLYMIQLAAFRSAERAEEMAGILSQKHKARLKNVNLKTMRVDNGSNGIFHRIVSVPLLRQDADKVCSILRRSGQDCFLRKYETKTP